MCLGVLRAKKIVGRGGFKGGTYSGFFLNDKSGGGIKEGENTYKHARKQELSNLQSS